MPVNPKLIQLALKALVWVVTHPDEIKGAFEKAMNSVGSMPNIPVKTLGGKTFWITLAEHEGWRLQKNKMLDYCRILDPKNVRRAWGSEEVMTKLVEELVAQANQTQR